MLHHVNLVANSYPHSCSIDHSRFVYKCMNSFKVEKLIHSFSLIFFVDDIETLSRFSSYFLCVSIKKMPLGYVSVGEGEEKDRNQKRNPPKD